VEGGISNGEVIAVTAYLKPLSTLMKPLDSVDIRTKRAAKAQKERSDVCAVPAAAVIGEAVLALCLGEALLEKVGGDSLGEVLRNLEQYRLQVERF
jgi:chorismate synthase